MSKGLLLKQMRRPTYLVIGLAAKRRLTRQHFIHQHTKRPIVDRKPVTASTDNLARDILGRPTHCKRLVLDHFGKSKVDHLDVATLVEQ